MSILEEKFFLKNVTVSAAAQFTGMTYSIQWSFESV